MTGMCNMTAARSAGGLFRRRLMSRSDVKRPQGAAVATTQLMRGGRA